MSFLSTLKSMFRSREQHRTRFTISLIYQNGSGHYDYPLSIPPHLENMLSPDQPLQRVVISKLSEQLYDTIVVRGERLWQLQFSPCPQNQTAATDGLRDLNAPVCSGPLGGLFISGASSSSASIPGRDPGQSSN